MFRQYGQMFARCQATEYWRAEDLGFFSLFTTYYVITFAKMAFIQIVEASFGNSENVLMRVFRAEYLCLRQSETRCVIVLLATN